MNSGRKVSRWAHLRKLSGPFAICAASVYKPEDGGGPRDMEEPASEGEWFANGTCEMEVMGSWNHGKRLIY